MPQSSLARAILFFCFGLSLCLLGAAAWLWSQGQSTSGFKVEQVGSSGTPLIGGPFSLVNQDGERVTEANFAGRPMLVYFGYTYCPDFCPNALTAMTQALDRLAENDPGLADKIAPVFITIDPDRDDVTAMAAYAPHFHENLVALTGTSEEVDVAAKAYRVYYAKAEDDASSEYLMDHTTFLYLMGPDGKYLTHFGHSATPDDIAAELAKLAG